MKSKRKPNCMLALLFIVQVCLLSLASVSPQIHAWAFHGRQSTNYACRETHTACSKLPQTSGEHESRSTVPGDGDEFCPVVLFAQGIVPSDSSGIQLPGRLAVTASIEVEPCTEWTNVSKGGVQARAPPVSLL